MLVRRHYRFYGRVQGVGFRITCYQIAIRLGLTGWVRNLSDGTVEACIQGEMTKIQSLISQLQESRFIRIEHFDVEELALLEKEKSFEMKY